MWCDGEIGAELGCVDTEGAAADVDARVAGDDALFGAAEDVAMKYPPLMLTTALAERPMDIQRGLSMATSP